MVWIASNPQTTNQQLVSSMGIRKKSNGSIEGWWSLLSKPRKTNHRQNAQQPSNIGYHQHAAENHQQTKTIHWEMKTSNKVILHHQEWLVSCHLIDAYCVFLNDTYFVGHQQFSDRALACVCAPGLRKLQLDIYIYI